MNFFIWLLSFAFLVFTVVFVLPRILIILGTKAHAEGKTAKALKYYRFASEKLHANKKIRCYYALMLMRVGEFKKAEQLLTEIVLDKKTKSQDKTLAKQYRCMAFAKQGKLDEALEDGTELFEIVKNTVMYGLLGYLKQLKGEDTLEFCKEAYDYNNSDRDICDNLVVAYYRSGDLKKAQKIADDLREKFPTFVEGFYHSAMISHRMGNDKAATEYLEKIDGCNRTMLTTVSKEEIEELKGELQNAGV